MKPHTKNAERESPFRRPAKGQDFCQWAGIMFGVSQHATEDIALDLGITEQEVWRLEHSDDPDFREYALAFAENIYGDNPGYMTPPPERITLRFDGEDVTIPITAHYVAQNSNGFWHAFDHRPIQVFGAWLYPSYLPGDYVAFTAPERDWREQLYQVKWS